VHRHRGTARRAGWRLAALAACLVAAAPAAAAPATQTIRIVNRTGVDPDQVFVTLVPGNGASGQSPSGLPPGLTMGTPSALDPLNAVTPWTDEGGGSYSVDVTGPWTSGTILYSLGNGGGDFTGYAQQPPVGTNANRYDFSELTLDANGSFNGDISAVTQIGIPARLSVLTPGGDLAVRDGTDVPATEYVGCVDATRAALDGVAPGWTAEAAGVWRTRPGGGFLQIMAPGSQTAISAAYPSFAGSLGSLAGQTLRVRGRFAGGPGLPAAYYDYSGTVAADGSILLAATPGTLGLADAADGTGSTAYPSPQTIFVPGGEMVGHDPAVWPGALGYGVYSQNGPYILNGTGTPATTTGTVMNAVGNDVYGWIYGDLVVSFAMGYWGSGAGLDSAAWNTNATPPWGTPAGRAPYAAAWAGGAPFARWNVYQSATTATGTTYGMALGDRFAPAGSTSPEIGVTPAPQGGSYGTWQVALLARHGCARLDAISPTGGPAAGGQVVTITGQNIHPGAGVTFGGIPAAGVTVSEDPVGGVSTITAVTPPAPPGGGLVDVQVTNADGSAVPPVDTDVLPGAYAYPLPSPPPAPAPAPAPASEPLSATPSPVPAPLPAPRPPGAGVGGDVLAHPGAGCATTRIVGPPLGRRPGAGPRVGVPAGGITRLVVHGLPRGGEASVDARDGAEWGYLGRVRVRGGRAVLPRLSVARPGPVTVRVRDGRTERYGTLVATPAPAWSGTIVAPGVAVLPVGACPARTLTVDPRRPALTRIPADTTLRLRVPGRRPVRAAVQTSRGWRTLGRPARSGDAVILPPLRLGAGARATLRIRAGGRTALLRLAATG
jgi:hypothetical protein